MTDEPWIRRVAMTRGGPTDKFLLGLYVGEVCLHGTCDRPPNHPGKCSQFGGPRDDDAVEPHPVGARAGDIDWPATIAEYQRLHRPHPTPDAPQFLQRAPKCDLCDDTGALKARAKRHPSAPLRAELAGNILTLYCYVPTCGRVVTRFVLGSSSESAESSSGTN